MRDEWALRWHLLQRSEVAFCEVTHLGRVPGLSVPRGALCHCREALGPQLGGDLVVEGCFNSHSPLSYILLLALQESLPFCQFSNTCHKTCFKYFIQCFSSFSQVGFSGYAVCHNVGGSLSQLLGKSISPPGPRPRRQGAQGSSLQIFSTDPLEPASSNVRISQAASYLERRRP